MVPRRFSGEALRLAGGIDVTFPGCYDLDAWLRMSLIRPGNLVAIPEFSYLLSTASRTAYSGRSHDGALLQSI